MLFKNSVRTSKRTPHFTITKINWLTLFKFNCLLFALPCSYRLLDLQRSTYTAGECHAQSRRKPHHGRVVRCLIVLITNNSNKIQCKSNIKTFINRAGTQALNFTCPLTTTLKTRSKTKYMLPPGGRLRNYYSVSYF
jgi:hypothetical protein